MRINIPKDRKFPYKDNYTAGKIRNNQGGHKRTLAPVMKDFCKLV